jgi:hypothetical protein
VLQVYGMKLFADLEAERLTRETGKPHGVRLMQNGWQYGVVRVATFLVKRIPGHRNERWVCRETGDQYFIVDGVLVWKMYLNGSYQGFRNSRADVVAWIEREASISL